MRRTAFVRAPTLDVENPSLMTLRSPVNWAPSTSCWVQHRREAVGERPHRRRWREHLHGAGPRARLGSRPAAEGKREQAVGEHESRLAVCADDHGAIWQRLEVGSPGLAVAAAVDAAPAPQAFGREPPIELDGTQRWIDGVAV